MRFDGAGHPPLFIIRVGGAIEMLCIVFPSPGRRRRPRLQEIRRRDPPGDTILLYTDGLYSATSAKGWRIVPNDFRAFFPRASASAAEFLDRTVAAISASDEGALPDDVAAIALRRYQRIPIPTHRTLRAQ